MIRPKQSLSLYLIQNGRVEETYSIGGDSEWKNIGIVNKICELLAEELKENLIEFKKLITFVKDRPGHDLRYAIDSTKIKHELDWQSEETFKTGLKKTIRWYLNNKTWIYSIKTGAYKNWLANNYNNRI